MELPRKGAQAPFAAGNSRAKRVEWLYNGDKEDGLRKGRGRLEYKLDYGGNLAPTFVIAEGEWENDVMHGLGSLTINGVKVYEGNWKHGSICLRKTDSAEECTISDLDLSNPAILDSMWMLSSNTYILQDVVDGENQEEACIKNRSSWLGRFMNDTLNLKQYTDTFEFLSLTGSWFMVCLLIFLIFIA